MNDIPVALMWIGILILFSAYFSGSETAMMSLNRYRLRHLVNKGHRGARKASRLLQRPDRLLGVILIGNNFVNFMAASIASAIGTQLMGQATSTLVTPIVLTMVVLIFAEVTPKTVAAQRAEALAFPSAYILQPLLTVCRPLVSIINAVSNSIAGPMVRRTQDHSDELTAEELKTVVNERSAIPRERQNMLLGILELENATVDDIMVPKSEIAGIDIDGEPRTIVHTIQQAQHTRLPVFKDGINNVIGMLHLRRAARFLADGEFRRAALVAETEEPYFVPEGTPLHTQLFNFQKEKQRIALVVDEYGDIAGIVTLEDILEEVVGEYTTDFAAQLVEVRREDDGSFIVDGKALLRDVNRSLGWNLPTAGPRTINGLVIEHLELIPESNVCLRIGAHRIETIQIADNVVRTVRIWHVA